MSPSLVTGSTALVDLRQFVFLRDGIATEQDVNLTHLKPRDGEIERRIQLQQVAELGRQFRHIPIGIVPDPVQSLPESTKLHLRQIVDRHSRHFSEAEAFGCLDQSPAIDHMTGLVDRDWQYEPPTIDKAGQLLNLAGRMFPGISPQTRKARHWDEPRV